MVSYLSWAANAVLFVAACFLAANTANTIFATMLAPAPTGNETGVALEGRRAPAWAERQVILERNLFNSSTAAAVDPEPIDDDIEATKLPLQLLGTTAAEDPAYAWAAVQDKESRETLVVTIGDSLKGKATVERIERRRLVLLENGSYRELTIGDDALIASAMRTARVRAPQARTRPSRERNVRRIADNRFALPREEVEKALKDPSDILSQARFLPKYDGAEMVGFQVNAIKSGSVLEEFGMKNGDLITEFNGISINSPTESARMLQEFNESDEMTFEVEDKTGQSRTVNVDLN